MRENLRSNRFRKLFLAVMLIVAMASTVVGCGGKDRDADGQSENAQGTDVRDADGQSESSQSTDAPDADGQGNVLGEGQVLFYFTVVDAEGNERNYEIHTDKETVGDALLEHSLIAGDESAYGLYVKQVDGITADYDVDQTYWAFYVGDEYASAGVDSTPIKEGETYSFKVEK